MVIPEISFIFTYSFIYIYIHIYPNLSSAYFVMAISADWCLTVNC